MVFGLLLWGSLGLFTSAGELVRVTIDGEGVGTYALEEDQTVTLPHHTLQIKDGRVAIIQSDCTGQDCVKTAPIQAGNQALIRLPYHLNVQNMAKNESLDPVND